MLVVTVKYVVFVMRADNKGEGGMLSLMALAQRALGRAHGASSSSLGIVGAALFYGDGLITPAISVLSAVEGLKDAPGIRRSFAPYVLPIAAGILVAPVRRPVARHGQGRPLLRPDHAGLVRGAGRAGPASTWCASRRSCCAAQPLLRRRLPGPSTACVGFAILGCVFLAVTGAEALYADMGHFGRGPIRTAWLCRGLALPDC